MTTLPYRGTEGYVDRDASRERAEREARDGSAGDRQERITAFLLERGKFGATWVEVAEEIGEHHGKVSASLSVLHKAGTVFQLRQKRSRCHPYVHEVYRQAWLPEQRYDVSVRTRKRSNHDLAEIRDAVDQILVMTDLFTDDVSEFEVEAMINFIRKEALYVKECLGES